ncbi:D-glycero-alpha-D-manno-heptose-1,7-bisphosphate 7-phosphatase [Novimethylophilus kurashikiensis]|nr:HAD family hydrolase [Novimethylophilus kurashikiensis]
MRKPSKAIFIDKDGTLIDDVPFNVDPRRITLMPGAGQGLRLFRKMGYQLYVVSNQPGVAFGYFEPSDLDAVSHCISALLHGEGVRINGYYYCPHHRAGSVAAYSRTCDCRKPEPGLLLRAAEEHHLDLVHSWMIGDILNDIEAGQRAGCKTVLIDNGHETEWEVSPLRMPHFTAANLLEAAQALAALPPARSERADVMIGAMR